MVEGLGLWYLGSLAFRVQAALCLGSVGLRGLENFSSRLPVVRI